MERLPASAHPEKYTGSRLRCDPSRLGNSGSMPPRKGIVQSGNAGNSKKAVPNPAPDKAGPSPKGDQPAPTAGDGTTGEKPLFPPGSKTPLALLNERWLSRPFISFYACSEVRISWVVDVRRMDGKSRRLSLCVLPSTQPPFIPVRTGLFILFCRESWRKATPAPSA